MSQGQIYGVCLVKDEADIITCCRKNSAIVPFDCVCATDTPRQGYVARMLAPGMIGR
jgi:hypothetical protein